MREITIDTYPIEKNKIMEILQENNIRVNPYAQLLFAHSQFDAENLPPHITLRMCSLSELGLADGTVFRNICDRANEYGLSLCHPATGLFLRLAYTQQAKSNNSKLSGTHHSPDGAVIVLSERLVEDDAFPKGLYLRNVDGQLWLRGYVCDRTYGWSAEDVFAFEIRK